MLDGYLQASIGQLLERARSLQSSIARPKAREFHALWQLSRDHLNTAIRALEALLADPRYRTPEAQSLRLRDYKRRVKDLDLLENIAFAALIRANRADERMTRLVGKIASEINYPLIPPAVSCQSQFYFQAYPLFNLLSVPQKEAEFLLHLPDLYHELGHFLLMEENNPQVVAFQKAYEKTIADALTYLHDLRSKPSRGPVSDVAVLSMWEYCWVNAWAAELYCDLFGVCASGAAYAWAHLHLCTKRGGDPYHVDRSPFSSHPSDEARMMVALHALTVLGFARAATEIEEKWRMLLTIGGYKPKADYTRCFNRKLLKGIADDAVAAYAAIGCVDAAAQAGKARVYTTLNEGWITFWSDPQGYASWEKAKVSELFPDTR
jgi:hypothetical protein